MGIFDDLIPAQKSGGMFDDLIPKAGQGLPAASQSVAAPQSVTEKLLGINGPRYQIWPERAIRSLASAGIDAATLPGQVVQEAQQPAPKEISDSDVSTLSVPRSLNMATILAPANPMVRSGDSAIPGAILATKAVKPVVPTTKELARAGANDITAAKNSGLTVSASSVGQMSKNIQQQLMDSGIHPVQADATFKILKELENAPPGATATAANLQSLRETLGNVAQNFNPNAAKDQLAASRSVKGLDQFIPNVDPKDVLAGTPAETASLLQRGRGNYAAGMRSNDLTGELDRANTGILERAQTRAQASNSGRNLDNTIRQKIASILEKPKEVSGLSDEEISKLNDVAAGGTVRNTARYVGNLLGGGGGLGQAIVTGLGASAGAAAGGVPGAVLGASAPVAAGSIAKSIANALAKRSLGKADELIRMRSPLYQDRVNNPAMQVISPAKRSAIARALLTMGQQQQ